MKEHLYHYTSIETLLLILKNKTIAFNSLQNVDDLDETESEDIEQIGKVCYVSCWTDDDSELIPMWNMYTPDMTGVRISLPKFPFKKYYYKKGEYHLSTDCESYINCEKLYNDDKASISLDNPKLIKVEYTDDKSKLYPKIKNIKHEYNRDSDGKLCSTTSTNYSFKDLGKYKRKNWEFQHEVRYVINMAPYSMKELEKCKSYADQVKLIDRIEDTKIKEPYKRFFLELSDEALNEMEILLGPKVREEQVELVKLIVQQYCLNAKIQRSKLKIR